MDLIAKLQKLKDEQSRIEARIAEQRAARDVILGSIFPILLAHPNIRRYVQTEGFASKLNRAQAEALSAALEETVEVPSMASASEEKDAGGVLGGPKTEASAAPDAGQQS